MLSKVKNVFFNPSFLKFLIVGLSGIIVNSFFLFLFKNFLNLRLELSGFMAIEFSVISNFLLNHYWTFRDRGEKNQIHFTFLRYHLSVLLGMIINYFILLFLTKQIGVVYWFSNLIGIGFGTISNYLFSYAWAWKRN